MESQVENSKVEKELLEIKKDNERLHRALKLIADYATGEATWFETLKSFSTKKKTDIFKA